MRRLVHKEGPGVAGDKLNLSQQFHVTVKKAKCILGCISRSIASRSREFFVSLYLALVRLHLEYYILCGASRYKKDIGIME